MSGCGKRVVSTYNESEDGRPAGNLGKSGSTQRDLNFVFVCGG